MTEDAKLMYEDALNDYIEARKALTATTIAYDNARHAMRVKLYEEKMAGTKYTEEQIRSITIDACRTERENHENAMMFYDIAKESLEFIKATCNKVDFN